MRSDLERASECFVLFLFFFFFFFFFFFLFPAASHGVEQTDNPVEKSDSWSRDEQKVKLRCVKFSVAEPEGQWVEMEGRR